MQYILIRVLITVSRRQVPILVEALANLFGAKRADAIQAEAEEHSVLFSKADVKS